MEVTQNVTDEAVTAYLAFDTRLGLVCRFLHGALIVMCIFTGHIVSILVTALIAASLQDTRCRDVACSTQSNINALLLHTQRLRMV